MVVRLAGNLMSGSLPMVEVQGASVIEYRRARVTVRPLAELEKLGELGVRRRK